MLRSYLFDALYVFHTVNHQRDLRALACRMRNGSDVLLIPGGITNQQVLETLRSQVYSFLCGEAHNTLKTGMGRENSPEYGNTAQRLGSETNLFSMRVNNNLLDVLVKQIEIDKG